MYYYENHGYIYPEKSDQHMIDVKHLRDTHFDENYPYLDTSLWYRFKRGLLRVSFYAFVFLVVKLVHGVKIHGRKDFKKNKKILKDGAITVCNHVFMWDYLCILMAIRPVYGYFPAWATNFEGPNGPLIRNVGGIPIPTKSLKGMMKFKNTIDELLENKEWIHFYPEGSMWYYYPDIRPIKPAVCKFAVAHDKPIIPLTISFRPRKGLYKIYKRRPCVDVNIGEPIYINKELQAREQIFDLQKRVYEKMQLMNGIDKNHPRYNDSLDIDSYTMHKTLK